MLHFYSHMLCCKHRHTLSPSHKERHIFRRDEANLPALWCYAQFSKLMQHLFSLRVSDDEKMFQPICQLTYEQVCSSSLEFSCHVASRNVNDYTSNAHTRLLLKWNDCVCYCLVYCKVFTSNLLKQWLNRSANEAIKC